MTLVPLFLSIESLFGQALFIALGITAATTLYICLAMPYLTNLDNIRLLSHRFLVLLLLGFQILTQSKTQSSDPQSFKSIYPWIIISILSVGAALNGTYIIWKTYLWIKKPGIIDMKLFVQQKGTTQKFVPVDYIPPPDGKSFPKL